MAASKAQRAASAKYDASHTIQIKLKLNTKTDADIIEQLDAITNKQGYIKDLIRRDATGHWIVHPKGIYAHLVCDRCLSNAPYDCETNYCPDCGARMVDRKIEKNIKG